MEVILLERIEKIGKLGDVVKVKDGFARNYLLPQKKALRANKENIAIYEKQKKIYEEKNAALLKEVQSIAKYMTNLSISIRKQASESGQLYGSVAAREIADTIKLKGHDVQTGIGKYGPFILYNKKFTSIDKYLEEKSKTLENITIEDCKEILKYPMKINKEISIHKGPYGTYMKYKGKNIKIKQNIEYTEKYCLSIIKK